MSLGARRRRPPTPGFVANELWRRAGAVPSFHIAPARTQNARDLITGSVLGSYNSASAAWAVGPDGVLALPAANAPVIEYDPVTLQCLGARIWGAVTNQIRNNTGVGAVPGTPGTLPTNWSAATSSNGLSRQIVGVGTVNGVDYVDIRYFGTTTAASNTVTQFENQTAVTAAPGETWTASVYVAIVGGSSSNINTTARLKVAGRNTSGAQQEFQQADHTIDSSLARKSTNAIFSNANTARVSVEFFFTYNSGVAIDVTYRFGLPQLEKSATMGPVVKTSGLAASSTADVWSIAGADFSRIFNNTQGTIYANFARNVPTAVTAYLFAANQVASAANRIDININAFQAVNPRTVVSGSAVSSIAAGTYTSNSNASIAYAYSVGDYATSLNGSSVIQDSTAGPLPSSLGEFYIGSLLGGSSFNGYIRELAIFRSRRPNANLQAMPQ